MRNDVYPTRNIGSLTFFGQKSATFDILSVNNCDYSFEVIVFYTKFNLRTIEDCASHFHFQPE